MRESNIARKKAVHITPEYHRRLLLGIASGWQPDSIEEKKAGMRTLCSKQKQRTLSGLGRDFGQCVALSLYRYVLLLRLLRLLLLRL